MATTVHEPPKIGSTRRGADSSGGNGDLIPASGSLRAVDDSSPASRTGVWVGMAAITMTFAAFTSAMVVRQGSSMDWRHFVLPSVLYFNTAVLLASSVTLGSPAPGFDSGHGDCRPSVGIPLLWLYLTLGLGLLFVAGHYAAWLQLKAEGLVSGNQPEQLILLSVYRHPRPSCAGRTGGTYSGNLAFLSKPVPTLQPSTLSTVSYYWHFMDVLWIYLLLLLWARI